MENTVRAFDDLDGFLASVMPATKEEYKKTGK